MADGIILLSLTILALIIIALAIWDLRRSR